MNIEKHFNPKRFINYVKYDLKVNFKNNLFLAIGLLACMFVICFIVVNSTNRIISINQYFTIFSLAFGSCILIIFSQTFKSLRQKRDLTQFLMLPASTLEKFISEFVLKIIVFITLFTPILWFVFKITVPFCNLFRWHKPLIINNVNSPLPISFLDKNIPLLLDRSALFLSIFSLICFLFAGASYFKKYALIKTIIAFAILIGIFFLNMIVFSHIFFDNPKKEFFYIELTDYRINKNLYNIQLLLYILGSLSSLFLLPIAYYNLKEKTV